MTNPFCLLEGLHKDAEPLPPPVAGDEPTQIALCSVQRLGYMQAIDDAERRMRKGQHQQYCLLCTLWKWPGQQCAMGQQRTQELDTLPRQEPTQ